MKNIFFLFLIILITFNIYSKRMSPKDVKSIIYNGIEYKVNHQKIGYIEAWDLNKKYFLWEIKVYSISFNSQLEKDVQDLFIVNIFLDNDNLIIVNEKNDYYSLNLKNKYIKKLTREEIKKYIK